MKTKDISPNYKKVNKFGRTLNINKKQNLAFKSKSNNKLDIKMTKPIKIKNINKLKNNIQQNKYNNTQTNIENKEKEIDASLEEYLDKDIFKPINSNKNIQKSNTNPLEKNNYIKLNNKSQNKTTKNHKTQINKNYIDNNNNNIHNYNQLINGGNDKKTKGKGKFNLNIILNNKSPIRLRKINTDKKYGYGIDCLSTNKKEKQINTIFVNNNKNMNMDLNMNIYNNDYNSLNNNTTLNNDESTILNLQEEIENQKRENLYKEMVINDMKQKLEDIKKDKDKRISNGNSISNININNDVYLLKQEIDIINKKIINDINYNSFNNDKNININKDEVILFDKLKNNYSNNKNLINELTNENEQIKKKINDTTIINGNRKKNYSYLIIEKQKKSLINIASNVNKNIINYDNDYKYLDDNYDIISSYIENALKASNKDYFNKNELNNEQINNIKLMIKMTLNSNYIPEDDIISLFMNNLLNYNNSIDIFCTKYMKTNSISDKEIIQNYFKYICIDDKNKFNINNIFNEIKSLYDESVKKIEKIEINDYFSKKKNIFIQILKDCKLIDTKNIGLIELNQFKNILNKYQFLEQYTKNQNEIFNILLYNMKRNIDLEQIGLYELSYYNLYDNLGLNDSLIKENFSDNNSSIAIEKNENEKKNALFYKGNDEKEEKEKNGKKEKNIQKKIISNVDFKPDENAKERGSGNSNNTYGLLSSKKFSFDYSSKSGSKEASSLKDGINKITSEFIENEEYLAIFCKNYVDNLFNICLKDVQRKKQSIYCNFYFDTDIIKK